MRSNRPTIKDVAKRAGVSFKTVSRVINQQPGVRVEVRQRVLQTIAEVGYVVNYSAKSLASGSSRTIGVVIPRLTDPYTFQVVHHLGEISEQLGVGLVILTRFGLGGDLDVNQFIGHGMLGGVLLYAPRSLERYLPLIHTLRVPAVVYNTVFADESGKLSDVSLPIVAADHRGGAYAGVSHLIEMGHRRIAFVGDTDSSQGYMRYLGYRDALREHGLANDNVNYVLPGYWTWESGYDAALQLMGLPETPSAIFCANDNMALGAMRALQERGLRIPDDVSMLGFDDIPSASQSHPPLSTIRQPTQEMVRDAIGLLIHGMDGEAMCAGHRIMPTTLVARATCAPPRNSV